MNNRQDGTTPTGSVTALQERMQQKIQAVAAVADDLPSVVIILNYPKGMTVEYMSKRGAKMLGHTLEEIRSLGTEYHARFFNQEESAENIAIMSDLLEKNDDEEIASLFQQVRASEELPWSWYLSTLKVFMRDDDGNILLILVLASPIDPLHNVTTKVSRLLDENDFLRKNYSRFSKLSEREREILCHIALGKSAAESAQDLYISSTTVETHRRNIKRKLNTHSFFELTQFARAFDLI